MTRLLSSLTQIALLRRDASILPASWSWVVLFALGYAATNALVAWVDDADGIFARIALDLVLAFAFMWLLLALTNRTHRLPQTAIAVFGVYILLAPAVTVLLLMRVPSESNHAIAFLSTAGSILITIWYLLIVGHILKGALDTGLVTGFAMAVTWLLASVAVARFFFGTAT